MRIIAGRYKGLQLRAPAGDDVRPTMDRVREALFSILADSVAQARVLDLFAGSGSLGLEALSRGASDALFVERSRPVADILRQNIEHLGAENARVMVAPVERILKQLARQQQRFDLVFLDPPYRRQLVPRIIGDLERLGLVNPRGRIVAEHEQRYSPPMEIGRFFRVDVRRYGDTALSIYSPLG